MKRKGFLIVGLLTIFLLGIVSPQVSVSQEKGESNVVVETEAAEKSIVPQEGIPSEEQVVGKKVKKMSLFQLIMKGGIVGYLIILLSIVALGLVLDYTITIRRSKLVPHKDVVLIKKLIKDNRLEDLKKMDKENSSFLSQIVIAGLNEVDFGYQAMIKAMEDASEALSARIARKIEHLNVIGNISPMMGLLGTVIGMLRCFNEISQVTGAIEPKQLAGGIFEALVTTCMGLIVAIPALYFFAIFKNRVDEFLGEASLTAEELVASFKTGNQKGQ